MDVVRGFDQLEYLSIQAPVLSQLINDVIGDTIAGKARLQFFRVNYLTHKLQVRNTFVMDTGGYSGASKSHFYEGYLDQLEHFKNQYTPETFYAESVTDDMPVIFDGLTRGIVSCPEL